jgi:hypothetical protein
MLMIYGYKRYDRENRCDAGAYGEYIGHFCGMQEDCCRTDDGMGGILLYWRGFFSIGRDGLWGWGWLLFLKTAAISTSWIRLL